MKITGFNESRRPKEDAYYKSSCLCGTEFMFTSKELDAYFNITCPVCGRQLNINDNIAMQQSSEGKTVVVKKLIEEISESEFNGEDKVEQLDMKKKLLDSLFKKIGGVD